jgi:molybdenum cofactor synthesis domain-containing protein
MRPIEILSVNTSLKKGTVKNPVECIHLNATGIDEDAHAGLWNRQVSLLGVESIEKMEPAAGRKLKFGEFAENITTRGYALYTMKPLDRLSCKDIVLEVTQIGKKCHGESCAIFKQTGNCVMPAEGIFCRVIHGGILKAGDTLQYEPKIIRTGIITLSDRASRGEYEDQSGPEIERMLKAYFAASGLHAVFESAIIPDEPQKLTSAIGTMVEKCDFIFTTGGTGIGPRDIAPDTIKPMLDKEITGIMEVIRVKYGMQFPNALMSRSIAGTIGRTLIYALPGSPKAVREYTEEIVKTMEHALLMLHSIDKHG